MSEHLLKILAAYAAGTAATAFIVSFVWITPIPDYAKQLVSWITPLPVILVVLVLLYYGPQSFAEGEALPATPGGIARVFATGFLTAVFFYAIVPVTKYLLRRFGGGEDGETEQD